jgi:hypothetical protein
MSAVFIIRQKYCSHMVTDGALVGPDLRMTGILAKTMPLPHLSCAITVRCSEIDMLAQLVLAGLAPDMATLRARSRDAVNKLAEIGRGLEIFVAGCAARPRALASADSCSSPRCTAIASSPRC